MTTTDIEHELVVGVHAVYSDESYDARVLGSYLVSLNETWRASYYLAAGPRPPLTGRPVRGMRVDPTKVMTRRVTGRTLGDLRGLPRSAQEVSPTSPHPTLTVSQLRIASPMDLTLAVQGGSVAAVTYGAHLFVRMLRDPHRAGAWLPRLVAGWHTGQREAGMAKQAREQVEAKQNDAATALTDLAERLTELMPRQVDPIGAGDTPADILEAARE